MVSRCKIISRSSNELYSCHNMYDLQDEDVWFNPDKLYQDHILEILQKWDAIDDEIWAKIIVMERNRRVAKAYVRAPAISINGSEAGFDGYTIGINGFESTTSDAKVLQVKKMIGKGVKLKMDQFGSILIKRLSRCNVFIRTNNHSNTSSSKSSSLSSSSSSSSSSTCVPIEKAIKLFDMKLFASNIDKELMNSYPDRRKLESQCITLITFVQDSPSSILDSPCYLLLINIVAIDMLKSKLPPNLPPSIHQSSLSSNSSNGSSSQRPLGRKAGTKFTSFDPKVTYSSSGTSSGDSTNPYIETNNNNNYNHNQRKSSIGKQLVNGQLAPSNGRRHRSPDHSLPTPDYDEEEIEQVYGRTRYQKNTSPSSKPISSKSSGKLISPIKSKTTHPLKPFQEMNRSNHVQSNPRLNQSNYGLDRNTNYKLSKSQSTSHLNSYQSKSSSNGFSLSDSSDPYTSIKTSLDSEEIYPAFRGGFGTHALFDYHPFGGISSGRMTESSFTDDDINPYKSNNQKSRSNPNEINTRSPEKPYSLKYARNWK